MLIEHLIRDHGKRRILFLRGPVHQEDSARREAGYKSALAANGIPFDENLVLNGDFERDIAYEAMNKILGNGRHVAFDSIFTGDDDAAIGVLKSLHEHSIRIPEDVSVMDWHRHAELAERAYDHTAKVIEEQRARGHRLFH